MLPPTCPDCDAMANGVSEDFQPVKMRRSVHTLEEPREVWLHPCGHKVVEWTVDLTGIKQIVMASGKVWNR